ncbi:cytochrome C biogenesis protein [Pasteurellaceae bacterium Pebbles2]|nr:cytochrome C biogenesis protein [Pasteurellaceae bacterium Pebbles2]
MKKFTALLALASLFFSVSAFSAIDALNFQSPRQEQDYHQLTQELRCPQCQNNNIADSNATIAVDMRAKVFELLQEGKNKQDIVNYMVERYGNFVTYNPPLNPATVLLWLVPALLVLFGVILVLKRKSPQKTAVQKDEVLSDAEAQRLQAILNNKEE